MLLSPQTLARLERLTLMSRRALAGQLQGQRRSPKRGQSIEFADFRPYTRGDDFRRIDWNAYARLERLFIKLFVEEEDLTIHLLLDTSRSMDWGEPNKLHYARQAAAALGYVALHSLDRVTVTAFAPRQNTSALPALRGKANAPQLFSFLESLPPAERTDLGPRLQRYALQAAQRGPLLLFSDLLDPTWQQGLHALAGRSFEITVLHILAPQEYNPNLRGDLKLRDIETGQCLEISLDDITLRHYHETLDSWQREIRAFCQARRILYLPVRSDTPLESLIFAHLAAHGLVK
ncbi:MAG: DUF58 domain-containing protein [Anaerolineales bacterium]